MKLKRLLIIIGGIDLGAVLFCLILLPLLLVSIFPKSEEQPNPALLLPPDDPVYINVYRHQSKTTEQINFEDYVKGVVAGEMPATFEPEALKAQAVAARTYSLSKVIRSGDGGNPDHPSAPVCDDTHCQVYRSVEELSQIKSAEWMATGWPRIIEAVDSTRGELLYYQGALVEQPLFHSASGGKTENSEDVFVSALPYLRSVDSPYETEAPHQGDQVSLSLSDFEKKIKKAYPKTSIGKVSSSTVKITNRSEGGRVATVQVGDLTLKGREIRDICGLRSANFSLSFQGGNIIFTSSGYGHGVGMSQWGANGMAQQGYTYQEILAHYYSGVEIKRQ